MPSEKECPVCKGWGEYLAEVFTGDRDYVREEVIECEQCDGKGYLEDETDD